MYFTQNQLIDSKNTFYQKPKWKLVDNIANEAIYQLQDCKSLYFTH